MAPNYPILYDTCLGRMSVPQVFFNSRHVGGSEEVEKMEREGVLGDLVRECLEGGSGEGEFPPPLRTPSSEELLQVVVTFRIKYAL